MAPLLLLPPPPLEQPRIRPLRALRSLPSAGRDDRAPPLHRHSRALRGRGRGGLEPHVLRSLGHLGHLLVGHHVIAYSRHHVFARHLLHASAPSTLRGK